MNSQSTFTREELLRIARSQSTIITLILLNLLFIIGLVCSLIALGPGHWSAGVEVSAVRWILILLNLIAVVFIYRLAKALRQTAWVYALAAFFPCVGLYYAASHQPLRHTRFAATRGARGFNGGSQERR